MQIEETLIHGQLENRGLSLEQVARFCAVEREWLLNHVEEGLLAALPDFAAEPRFASTVIVRVKRTGRAGSGSAGRNRCLAEQALSGRI
jgi:hypothetical protein